MNGVCQKFNSNDELVVVLRPTPPDHPVPLFSNMSAPQIPNLHTLRRGGPRSRAGGAGGFAGLNDRPHQSRPDKDNIIRNTDNDAAASRLSAVEAGYLDDPFAKLLSTNEEFSRRLPLMNRGRVVNSQAMGLI